MSGSFTSGGENMTFKKLLWSHSEYNHHLYVGEAFSLKKLQKNTQSCKNLRTNTILNLKTQVKRKNFKRKQNIIRLSLEKIFAAII